MRVLWFMRSRLACIVLSCFAWGVTAAHGAEVRPATQIPAAQVLAVPAPPPVSVSVFEPVTSGAFTPGFGNATLGVLPDGSPFQDFTATYKAGLLGSEVGVFGGFNSRANMFESAPTNGWNFGASFGYRGFYLRAGMSSDATLASATLLNDANKGWLAGLGYAFGAFDLRVTYMASQSIGLMNNVPDSRLWMIGGIYQLTPRVRVNADAFTGGRDLRSTTNVLTAPAQTVAPQGTGARVGVQLKF
jgi:hypothetical protein